MSHLNKILEYKQSLADDGVDCPKEQNRLIELCFIRATVAYMRSPLLGRKHCTKEELAEVQNDARNVLNEWNRVHRLNDSLIFATAIRYINVIEHNLATTGCVSSEIDDEVVIAMNDERLKSNDSLELIECVRKELVCYAK